MSVFPTHRPKNLTEARRVIAELQTRLGLSSDKSSPPIARPATSLHPQLRSQAPLKAAVDLANLPPKDLRDFFENSTTSDLRAYLSAETAKSRKHQNPAVVGALYRELKERKS